MNLSNEKNQESHLFKILRVTIKLEHTVYNTTR